MEQGSGSLEYSPKPGRWRREGRAGMPQRSEYWRGEALHGFVLVGHQGALANRCWLDASGQLVTVPLAYERLAYRIFDQAGQPDLHWANNYIFPTVLGAMAAVERAAAERL